jgi:hypothetical protein
MQLKMDSPVMSQPLNVVTPLSEKWRTNPQTRLGFVLALVETVPSVKVAPVGQTHLATRDPSIIEGWELQGIETTIHGIKLYR